MLRERFLALLRTRKSRRGECSANINISPILTGSLYFITLWRVEFISGIVASAQCCRSFMGRIGLILRGIISILFGFSTSLAHTLELLVAPFEWVHRLCASVRRTHRYSRTKSARRLVGITMERHITSAAHSNPIVIAAAALRITAGVRDDDCWL